MNALLTIGGGGEHCYEIYNGEKSDANSETRVVMALRLENA